MAVIEATLAAANATSDIVPGGELCTYQGSSMSAAVGLQVVRASGSGNFEVRLEGGFTRSSGTQFSTVATITQADVNNLITLTIAPGASYRYRVESIAASTSVVCIAG